MPTVQKAVREVQTGALPGARKTGGATAISEGAGVAAEREGRALVGAQIGEDLQRQGTRLYAEQKSDERRIAEEERLRHIRNQVYEAENKLSKHENDRYYNPDSGYMHQRGKATFELPEQANAEYEKIANEIQAQIGSPEGREMFGAVRLRRQAAADLALRRHVDNQMQVHKAEVMKANIENGIEEAVRANTALRADGSLDVTAGQQRMGDTVRKFLDQAGALGISDEAAQEQVKAITTRVHEGTITTYATNGNVAAARAYYAEMENQINQERHDPIEKMLKAGGVKKDAQTKSDEIIAKHGTGPEAQAEAKKIKDADVREEVEQRLDVENRRKREFERQASEDLMLSLANKVRQTGTTKSFTAKELSMLTATQHEMFREYERSLLSPATAIKTDPGRMQFLFGLANTDPKAFMERDLVKTDLTRLSASDLQEMQRMQFNMRQGNKKDVDAAMSGYLTESQVVNEVMHQAGLDTAPTEGTPEFETMAKLRLAVNQQISAWKQEHPGTTISSEQIQQIADGMLKEAVTEKGTGKLETLVPWTSGHYSDVRKRIGLVTFDDMTPEDKVEAANYLRGKNRPVNDATILQVHRAYLAREAMKAK